MSQRIKGQEVSISVITNGQPVDSLETAKSLDFTFKLEILQEGYLGETTDRYDSVYKGVSGNVEFHYSNAAPLNLAVGLIQKARRREANTKVNIKATLAFPSGRRARIIFRDVEFGELPFGFSSRSDYGTFKVSFACSEATPLPS